MKLALVTAYPPSKVTLTEYGYHLVKHFVANEEIEEIILLTDKTEAPKVIDFDTADTKITIKECWQFNSYTNLLNIQKAISSTKPDAVLYNLQFLKFGDKKVPAALGLMAPFITKRRRIPTISLLHNIMETVDLDNAGITSNRLLQSIYNFIGNTLTKFILASDKLAVTMPKYVGILEQKYRKNNIVQIPHGSFETPPNPVYTLPKGPQQIMAFGKFGTYKKVEIMIEAVAQLEQEIPQDLEIVIAGTDSPNTPGYLEHIAKKYEHMKNIRFTGYVPEADVPRIFQESAVVVFPYTSTTGSSGVLHQAGSYGKAVVLPNLGDLAGLVEEEGYKGEFFEPTTVDSLKEAIKRIVTNEDYRISLGINNYKAACSLPMSEIVQMYINEIKTIDNYKTPDMETNELYA